MYVTFHFDAYSNASDIRPWKESEFRFRLNSLSTFATLPYSCMNECVFCWVILVGTVPLCVCHSFQLIP